MWAYNYSNELYHHGILGMKWGHRKAISNITEKLASTGRKKISDLNSHEKRNANLRIKNNKKYGKSAKAAAIGNEVRYGVARHIGIALGTGTLHALSDVELAKGHTATASALSTISTVTYASASVANTVVTGKNVTYLLLAK